MTTITITFGDQAENHVGMEKIGNQAESGFTTEDLLAIPNKFAEYTTEFHDLTNLVDQASLETLELTELPSASLMIIRNGLQQMTENHLAELTAELQALSPDKQYWDRRRKRVLNKHARHNLCFGTVSQAPNYAEGKGTIVSYDELPVMKNLWARLPEFFGEKANDLVAEANYYYDVKKCGIGFHGDSERKKVIAFRIGQTMPFHYQWYYQHKPIGQRFITNLHHGDMYVMSEKAVGFDWKRWIVPTLRHAAGSEKYLK